MRRDPRETERTLLEIVKDQDGYFTAAQALSVGYTYRQQHHHKSHGNWLSIEHGVYRLRNYPDSEHEDLIRWSFWSRNRRGEFQATISHDTALALHDLGDVMPGKIHLTVPPGFRKKVPGGCILHRERLAPGDVERRRGFSVTTPLRTLHDAAASPLSPDLFEGAVRDALRRSLVQRRQLLSIQASPVVRNKLKMAVEAAERVEAA